MFVLTLSVDIGVSSILFDELAAWFYIITHQHRENLISLGCVLNSNLLEQSCRWVHSSFPKLLWIHLTQTTCRLRHLRWDSQARPSKG